MTKAPDIVTFGCRLNLYESEVIRTHVEAAGLEDVIIFNTCAVTAEAERQAGQTIRRLRRERPGATIIVTGCAAQISPEKYAAMEEVDFVLGNDDKMKAETYRALGGQKIHLTDIQDVRETAAHLVAGFEGKTRGFIQVQNGCDHRCTYCIIPFGRGPSRSVPIGAIVDQIRVLVADGYPEIALTGVDITSYGSDLPGQPRLGQMIRRMLALVPELKRLRLSSLDPVEIDEDLWELLAQEPRLMPHLHLSLQSGDDLILKRMKRRHSRQDVLDLCARARALRPDITFGADIITGFPTEEELMFENTLRLVEEAGLTFLHVFPYSARPGTPAAKMPQVRGEARKSRPARLRALGERAVERHIDGLIGQRMEVHVEQPHLGRTPTFAEVKLVGSATTGSLVTVLGVAREGQQLVGQIV